MADEAKEVQKVTTATAVVSGEKQGGKCCGSCCDYRRAVIVIAAICIVFYTIVLILTLTGTAYASVAATQADDDSVEAAAITYAALSGAASGLIGLFLFFYIWQLVAALKYNVCMLVTVIVMELICLGWELYYYIAISVDAGTTAYACVLAVFWAGLSIYPTAFLVKEIQAGIMSPETYEREKFSCCCT